VGRRASAAASSRIRALLDAKRGRRPITLFWGPAQSELRTFLTGVVTGAAILWLASSPESGGGSVATASGGGSVATASNSAMVPVEPVVQSMVAEPAANVVSANGTAETAALRPTDAPARSNAPRAGSPQQNRAVGTTGRPYRGSLAVTSRPSGAKVFLNQQLVGTTPLTLGRLEVGSRAVRVVLDGYRPWSRGVQIGANRVTSLNADLSPAP
jgi:hypothetical protein